MNRFTDKTILITGGTSGMGLATAHRLVAEGAHVIVTGRTRARVDSAVQELGQNASGIVADAADLGAVDALMEIVRDRHGQLDGLPPASGCATSSAARRCCTGWSMCWATNDPAISPWMRRTGQSGHGRWPKRRPRVSGTRTLPPRDRAGAYSVAEAAGAAAQGAPMQLGELLQAGLGTRGGADPYGGSDAPTTSSSRR
ncbi:SDR family NAD(P)-dependent oxidoreductase [Streptomyces sp. NPDC086033]|uniref:SDR family NAD(P)-dependent oxidoreductase n=1 Tax=Streptomyces sp. NPDC086033 TaxID=3365747 RepID=UPI0037D07879